MEEFTNFKPCKGCTKRTATCHGTCEDYKKFRQLHEEKVAEVKMQKVLDTPAESRIKKLNHYKKKKYRV